MTSLNDVLLAMSNIPVDDPIAEIWGRGLQGGHEIIEYTGTLPISITADGNALLDYRIYGNTVRDGTPTPENPVDVVGCGVRTENLWDENYESITEVNLIYKPMNVGNGSFTLSTNTPLAPAGAALFFLPGQQSSGASTAQHGVYDGSPRTVTSTDGYVTLAYRIYHGKDPRDYQTMLNLGSTALPYEPYGYKLPMLSNSAVTNIYLGEVETTRRIKKLVLTGEEDYTWYKSSTRNYSWYIYPYEIGSIAHTPFYCSHGETVTSVSDYAFGKVYCDNTCNLGIFDNSIDSNAKLKAYFAQQYVNGTPVTIWYVLAEPETGIVNEPLMKIGDYTDTIDSTQANVQIPTFAGTTVIDYGGEPKPEKMYIKYRG